MLFLRTHGGFGVCWGLMPAIRAERGDASTLRYYYNKCDLMIYTIYVQQTKTFSLELFSYLSLFFFFFSFIFFSSFLVFIFFFLGIV